MEDNEHEDCGSIRYIDGKPHYVEYSEPEDLLLPVLAETAEWWVTTDGLVGKEHGHYRIQKYQLADPEWIAHMSEKVQIDISMFAEAFYLARRTLAVGDASRTIPVSVRLGGQGPGYLNGGEAEGSIDQVISLGDVDEEDDRPTVSILVDPASADVVESRAQ